MAPTVAKQRLPIEQRTKGYTVISQNITSWQPHAAEIVEYKPNLTCIQEHALGKQAEKTARKFLRRHGNSARFGALRETGYAKIKGGTMITARGPPLRPLACLVDQNAFDTGRICTATHDLKDGIKLGVVNLYSPVGSERDKKEKREAWISIAFGVLEECRGTPCIVTGDFNDTENSFATGELAELGWFDLARVAEARLGIPLSNTCYSSPKGTRIDRVYGNDLAIRALADFEVGWVGTVTTHMAIRITFVWNELNEKVLQYRKPPKIHADHMPEPKVTELFENGIWDSARHGSQNTRSNELQRAKQDKDPVRYFNTWTEGAEALLLRGAAELGEQVKRSHKGRGTNREPIKKQQFQPAARAGRSGDF